MRSLLLTFIFVFTHCTLVTSNDAYLASVEENNDHACFTTGFDGFRMERNVEGHMKLVEAVGFTAFEVYYKDYAALGRRPTSQTRNLNDIETQGFSAEDENKATVDKLFTYVYELRRNIVDCLRFYHKCDASKIAKCMKEYFNKNVKGKKHKACLIGTNFRFVDHMHNFLTWLLDGGRFHRAMRGKFEKNFVAFIPGLDKCWESGDLYVIQPIVKAMHGVAMDLTKSWTDDFFEIDTLKKDDIVKYLPQDERECIPNPAEIIGPYAFHTVVQFIYAHGITTEGICRESAPSALNYLKRKILFAVVRNSNEIGELLQQLSTESEKHMNAIHLLPSVIKAILSALSMPFPSTHLQGTTVTDATSEMLNMLGDTHGDHVCIQVMFIELLQLGQTVVANVDRNKVSSGCLSTTLIGKMFFGTVQDTSHKLIFGKDLMDTLNLDKIKIHFRKLFRELQEVSAGQEKATIQDSGLPAKLSLSSSDLAHTDHENSKRVSQQQNIFPPQNNDAHPELKSAKSLTSLSIPQRPEHSQRHQQGQISPHRNIPRHPSNNDVSGLKQTKSMGFLPIDRKS